jgi:hypothetical protein
MLWTFVWDVREFEFCLDLTFFIIVLSFSGRVLSYMFGWHVTIFFHILPTLHYHLPILRDAT